MNNNYNSKVVTSFYPLWNRKKKNKEKTVYKNVRQFQYCNFFETFNVFTIIEKWKIENVKKNEKFVMSLKTKKKISSI